MEISQVDSFLKDGFTTVAPPANQPPPAGYTVMGKDGIYVCLGPGEVRSSFGASADQAFAWGHFQAFKNSDQYPQVGEVWTYDGRIAVICGNTVSEHKTIWVMDWNSGDRAYALVEKLEPHADRKVLTEAILVARFTDWTRQGNFDAMWWLAWWFEGTNFPKSMWYYVAAIRANPDACSWALERIINDARSPNMCKGVPSPDLAFLKSIPELQGGAIGDDWESALANAEQAVHVPSPIQPVEAGQKMYRAAYAAPGSIS